MDIITFATGYVCESAPEWFYDPDNELSYDYWAWANE